MAIGAHQAKTHPFKLLARVQAGERCVITRHGRPVAALRPVDSRSRDDIQVAIAWLADLRAKHVSGGPGVRELIREAREGRKP